MRPAHALCALLLGACGGEGDTMIDDPIDPAECVSEMELGSGLREWLPVSDGDTVYLYRGPQGGWMIYLSVRARGMSPEDVTVDYVEKFAASGQTFGEDSWRVRLQNDVGDGWFERVGIWGAVFDEYWTASYMIRGQDARVDVTITDNTTGCQATDGWSVHIAEDPGT